MRHWFDINMTHCFKWCIVVHGSMNLNMTTCLTQGPGHGECYIVLNQKQFPVTTTSKNLPNNLKRQPHYNTLASTPASWILQYSKLKRLMAAFVLRTAAIACKKKEMSSTKWKCPSFTCDYSRNNIHPLKFKEVRHGQYLSVSVSVCQVKATSGQLILNGFTGLSPFITAVIILCQIDVNDRVI